MLELATQRSLHECVRYHASTPRIPGRVRGAGFFEILNWAPLLDDRGNSEASVYAARSPGRTVKRSRSDRTNETRLLPNLNRDLAIGPQ